MVFKVGQMVRICNKPEWKYGDGEIIAIGRSNWLNIKFNTSDCVICNSDQCPQAVHNKWFRVSSVEQIKVKGQQLLFEFMT